MFFRTSSSDGHTLGSSIPNRLTNGGDKAAGAAARRSQSVPRRQRSSVGRWAADIESITSSWVFSCSSGPVGLASKSTDSQVCDRT